MLLRAAEVIGHGVVDVRIDGDRVAAIGAPGDLCAGDEPVIDCHGSALLPGLQDHHCHLLASAADATSVHTGPSIDAAELSRRLHQAAPDAAGWVRGVGYDEAVAGDLDAPALDELSGPLPTRVQHRSGALWVVNSAGVSALGLADVQLDGVERDSAGRPTGRLWRLDGWLQDRWRGSDAPDVGAVSAQLARYGVVGVTDATPELDARRVEVLTSGAVRQNLTLLGADELATGFRLGPRKIVVGDHELPSWDGLAEKIRALRPRPVALHCVTRASLIFVLSVLTEVGTVDGDRIEHAAVAPPEAIRRMAELGLTVVTQPSLVRLRGGDYLDRVDAADRDCLWPVRSLLDAGVRVGLSSDAPYGALDPWLSIAAATDRATSDGRTVGPEERLDAWTALRAYLTPASDPGGPERIVATGVVADLALLDRPLSDALADPARVGVQLTLVAGKVVHDTQAGDAR